MTNKAKISDKISSTRYTVEQTQALKELKEKGINVSHALREAADIVIEKYQFLLDKKTH